MSKENTLKWLQSYIESIKPLHPEMKNEFATMLGQINAALMLSETGRVKQVIWDSATGRTNKG